MRRLPQFAVVALAALTTYVALPVMAHAQQRERPDTSEEDEAEAARKRKRDDEWGNNRAALPALRNAGPCPFVKTLYDAARYVEFKEDREASSNVAWSGEIQGVAAGCEYKDADPIKVKMEMLFELGRGPQAQGGSKTYRYWVAVTDRNRMVISKQTFDLPVTFPDDADRTYVREEIGEVVIPRANIGTSGANFEILVGFEVTPAMAAFNRDGKRFRLNAGAVAASPGTNPAQ